MKRVEQIEILGKCKKELLKLSKEKLLSFNSAELTAIQNYYKKLNRNPTDVELETIAQTWSEHCKHKTFCGKIEYMEGKKTEVIDNLLKSTIMKATEKIGKKKKGFLVSVFKDNAGVVSFNETHDVAFKVETHNHPSALEPYGGAATGIGGVIRDILGVGLGAKPVANTDVFCFGNFDLPYSKLPPGILHPKRIAKGVRAGVRDYGNRMGIPTVNGAILFEERYLGNPLVYCGTIGIMPRGMHEKKAKPDDLAVVIGGRTGRDGIHGVTFASVELEETTPSSPVQIGNPIEEKKFMDVLLQARDLGLYNCITDCGGGGFSSAFGEMAEETGIEIRLEKAPLKYKGLLPWEIWVSESQERMALAVPPEKLDKLKEIAEKEDVEVTVLGKFTNDKKLRLFYENELAGELEMEFLHKGVPRLKKKAVWKKPKNKEPKFVEPKDLNKVLKELLAMPNIASKETTVRQYDHEVQGGSVLKPLVGAENDGPGDAAIVRPLLDRKEAVIIANGINPLYGDIDPYWMAASAIDEAIRNLVCVGANIKRIALLDNFSWGNPDKPEKLAELVRAAKACHDFSLVFETPFISGKDSLYNEYLVKGKPISIPGTLLISAIAVMKNCSYRISMDLKKEGNLIYVLGETFNELGGSHYYRMHNAVGSNVPKVNAEKAKKLFKALHDCIDAKMVVAAHDCSEGGLGVAIAEMAFAGMLGVNVEIEKIPLGEKMKRDDFVLFSESNSRFVVEVKREKQNKFEKAMKGNKFALIGEVTSEKRLIVKGIDGKKIINSDLDELKRSWKETLRW